MQKDLRALLGGGLVLANLAVAVAAAVVVVLAWVLPHTLGAWDAANRTLTLGFNVRDTRVIGGLGLLLLVADVLFLLYGRAPRAPLRHIVSEVRDGTVLVTREAVENGLRAAGEALPEISRARVAIRQTALRRLIVHAQFTAPDGVAIQTAGQALRSTLRQRFDAMVQMPDGGRVEYELEFLGFSGRGPKKTVEPAPADATPGLPFTGPQYPIEEEDDAHGGRP